MDKKLLAAIALSLGTVLIFNHYTGKKDQPEVAGMVTVGQVSAPVSGQPIKVPTTQELYKPLILDIDFAEKKFSDTETVVNVETDYCQASFSNYGAVLTSLDFKKHHGKNKKPLRTVFNKGSFEEEQRKKGCFLLALDQKTPYLYKFVGRYDADNRMELTFKTENNQWEITKIYTLYKDSYQVDLELDFEPKIPGMAPIKPRLFFASPFIGELADDTATIISWNEQKETIEKTEPTHVQGLAWFWSSNKPLFGAEDRYFVHALINDPAKFVQRAYVKEFDTKNISSVLEGPEVHDKQAWKLSFYMGPKLFDRLNAVDNRLEEILSFGWLSWFCKALLKLLSAIHGLVGNFGLAIIIMTIILKLPFAPLSIYSRKKMEVYQHYQPAINKIRTKFRHDLKMQHEELMKFYRDHNISPSTHFVGCLPMLIQMPILFSLYRVLGNYLDMYQAPFIGWIVDLSAKDPYYVLPILMGLSMLWQQRMTPTTDEKQRVIMMFMSIVMTVVFANFAAGLVLYWLMNNLLTIGEDYIRKYFFN